MKEQKSGIFRKLFRTDTLNNEEQHTDLMNRAKTSTAFQEAANYLDIDNVEEEEVLPWERKSVQAEGVEPLAEVSEPVSESAPQTVAGPTSQPGALSWEELLNKISPPPVEKKADLPAQFSSTQDVSVETVEQIGVKPDLVETVEQIVVKTDLVETVVQTEAKTDLVETVEPVGVKTDTEVTVEPYGERSTGEIATDISEKFEVQTESAAGLVLEGSTPSEVFLATGTLEGIVESNESIQEVIEIRPLQNEQVKWLLEQAEDATSKGDFDKSAHLFDIACTLENHPDVHLMTAKFLIDVGNLAKGLDHCFKALELYPDSSEGAEMLLTLANSGVFISPENLAVIKTGTPNSSVKLAKLCLDLGYLAEALNLFARAQAQGHDMDDVQFELGVLYIKMGNPDQAIEHFKRNLELTHDALSACQLVELYLNGNRLALAKAVADQYLVDKVADAGIKQCLAKFNLVYGKDLLQSNQHEAALDALNSAMEAGIEEAEELVVTVLVQIADCSTDTAKAQEYYEAAMEISGFSAIVAEKLAGSYTDSGQYGKAITYLAQLYNQNPRDTKTTTKLAMCYQKIGDYGKAAELLETLAQYGELDRTTREHLYHYYQAQGKYDEALRHLAGIHEPDSDAYKSAVQNLAWDQIRFMVDNGDLESAWQVACRELQSKPSTDMMGLAMKILSERVDQLIAENKVNEALVELERGRTLGLNLLDLGLREASLYESIGNDRAALRVYEAVAAKAPEVWDKIKELYLKAATREYLAGNMAEARKLLEDGHSKLPDNGEICRALGVLYNETGQYALAVALSRDSMEETEIQISTDHLNVLRPHGYRRIRLG